MRGLSNIGEHTSGQRRELLSNPHFGQQASKPRARSMVIISTGFGNKVLGFDNSRVLRALVPRALPEDMRRSGWNTMVAVFADGRHLSGESCGNPLRKPEATTQHALKHSYLSGLACLAQSTKVFKGHRVWG